MTPETKEMCEKYWNRLWIRNMEPHKAVIDGYTSASSFYAGYISALEDLGMVKKEDYAELMAITLIGIDGD